MKVRTLLAAIAFGLGLFKAALADLPPVELSPIELKARRCTPCHGGKGKASNIPLWPNLAGQKEAYMIKQLKAFRPIGKNKPLREDPLMGEMAKTLTDNDIKELAVYFSGLPPPPSAISSTTPSAVPSATTLCPPQAATPVAPRATIEDKARICTACHGEKGISIISLWPNLAGQREAYIIKQMKVFRTNENEKPQRKDPLMGLMAKVLSDDDINELAAYFSRLTPTPATTASK